MGEQKAKLEYENRKEKRKHKFVEELSQQLLMADVFNRGLSFGQTLTERTKQSIKQASDLFDQLEETRKGLPGDEE